MCLLLRVAALVVGHLFPAVGAAAVFATKLAVQFLVVQLIQLPLVLAVRHGAGILAPATKDQALYLTQLPQLAEPVVRGHQVECQRLLVDLVQAVLILGLPPLLLHHRAILAVLLDMVLLVALAAYQETTTTLVAEVVLARLARLASHLAEVMAAQAALVVSMIFLEHRFTIPVAVVEVVVATAERTT